MNNIDKFEQSGTFPETAVLLKQQQSLAMPEASSFCQEYLKTMKLKYFVSMENLRITKVNLQQQGIESFQQRINSDSIDLKIISKSINQQVVILKATWGSFSMTINVLNIKQKNLKHGDQIQKGKFSYIYKRFHREQQFVIKCIPLTKYSNRNTAIKEWFIMKVASAAQFGPKLTAYYGFDILMFQTCAEFCMEFCKPIQPDNFKEKDVYQNLALMHAFHFVHLDIKPKNIMYSPSYKKIVFIDFGLSDVIKEEVGFKSLTNFVGSLSYCSQQMKECFIEDKQMQVDLYYNDLCCLNKSVGEILSFIQSQNEQEDNIFLYRSFHLNEDEAEYYDLYFLKFNLYTLRISECLTYWDKFVSFDLKKCFKRQLLQFLLELQPCQKLKQFFLTFVDESLTETSAYSKIKLIYQTAQQRLCSIELLKDEEKQSIYKQYCSQFAQIQINLEKFTSYNAQVLTLAELMMNSKEIKLIPFKKYVPLYLEYMSYMDNKNKITSVEREKAAITYYQLFISPERPSNLKGRQLVVNILKHILDILLNSPLFQEEREIFILIVFRLFDFFIILCSESSSELINLMSSLYHHHLLTEIYKTLFLLRVSHSFFFIAFRIFSKASQPRLKVIQKFFEWARAERDKLPLSKIKYQIMENYRQSNKAKVRLISQQFMKEFGTQIIEYQIIREKMLQEKSSHKYVSYIELFNKLNATQKPIKLFYFLLELYDYYLAYQSSSAICKKVHQIVKNNFGDSSLLEEFIFSTKFETLLIIKNQQNKDNKLQVLTYLSNEMKKVYEKDFIIFSHCFLDDFLKFFFFQSGGKILQSKKVHFMEQLYRYLLSYFQQEIFNSNKQNHTFHIALADLNKLFILCAFNKLSKVNQFQQKICNPSKLLQIQCLECRNRVSFYSKILQLQNYFLLYHSSRKTQKQLSQQDSDKILCLYLQQTLHLEAQLTKLDKQIKNFKSYKQIVLDLKLQFCKYDSLLEQKCHGIQEYFLFSLKCNDFSGYFHSNYQKSNAIISTMLFLFYKNYDYFLFFLGKLVQQFQTNLIYTNYLAITTYFFSFLKHNKRVVDKIFFDLRNHYKIQNDKTPYIIILYAILFRASESQSIQKNIVKEILTASFKLYVRFQRQIQIILLSKVLRTIKKSKEKWKQKRYFVYCNNKLLKLLMIEGKTTPISVVSADLKDPKIVLNNKASKMQMMNSKSLHVKLTRIRKQSLVN